MAHANHARRVLSEDEADARLVEIEKGQQLAGHFPDDDALDWACRILTGHLTLHEAFREIASKHAE